MYKVKFSSNSKTVFGEKQMNLLNNLVAQAYVSGAKVEVMGFVYDSEKN